MQNYLKIICCIMGALIRGGPFARTEIAKQLTV